MNARIVYASRTYTSSLTPHTVMHWRCSCGGRGADVPGAQRACPCCGETIRIPEEPMDIRPELAANAQPQPSTAWKLAAYRDELHTFGFTPSVAADLVLIAARDLDRLSVGSLFLARAEPPAPIVRIENYEPGSPEDLAIRQRFGLDGDGR